MSDWLTVLVGDCREQMWTLEAASVNCVVTSPPYWGLRDYGTASWDGGDPACDHRGEEVRTADTGGPKQQTKRGSIGVRSGDCRCGAVRQDRQLGLEATPELYVAAMVEVFAEVRRVLRNDGTVWLNLGDSYAGGDLLGRNDAGTTGGLGHNGGNKAGSGNPGPQGRMKRNTGLKPKDLVGIPWRVAFALQADGWYLRSDIIWAKPNPMPESVTDRPTKAHETVFLLTKSARYWYDADAVREPLSESTIRIHGSDAVARRGDDWKTDHVGNGHSGLYNGPERLERMAAGRNLRSVWNIPTHPYPGAHFATFPEALVVPCVKAGCPEGGVVMDPFAGTGTVGVVANRLSRRAILIDLNPDYIDQLHERNQQAPMGLTA